MHHDNCARKRAHARTILIANSCRNRTVLLHGVSDSLLRVQNAPARLVPGARRYDHITPVLYTSVAVRRRVGYKVSIAHRSEHASNALPLPVRRR